MMITFFHRHLITISRWPDYPLWMFLGISEYIGGLKALFVRSGPHCGRDFIAFTGFISFIALVCLLFLSLQRGFVVQLADVMLGKDPQEGIGIQVVGNVARINRIDRTVITDFRSRAAGAGDPRFRGLVLHPYQFIDASDHTIDLPSPDVWDTQAGGRPLKFEGWAVLEDDPLWRRCFGSAAAPTSELRPQLILNRDNFGHLNRNAYLAALAALLPPQVAEDFAHNFPPVGEITPDCTGRGAAAAEGSGATPRHTGPRVFWLSIGIGENQELIPFEVRWAESLSAEPNVSFVAPLALVRAFGHSRVNDLPYFPGATGSEAGRIGKVRIVGSSGLDITPEKRREIVHSLALCLGKRVGMPPIPGHGFEDVVMTLSPPLPERFVTSCLNSTGANAAGTVLSGDRQRVVAYGYAGDGWLTLPCPSLPRRDLGQRYNSDCLAGNDDARRAKGRIETWANLNAATVSMGDRNDIIAVVDALKTFESPDQPGIRAFQFERSYEESLLRFDFLQKLLAWMAWPLLAVFGGLMLYLMSLTLYTLIQRRREQYGLLLAQGMTSRDIRSMIAIQLTLSTAIGMLLPVVIIIFLSLVINFFFTFSAAYDLAVTKLGSQSVIVTMPFSVLDVLVIFWAIGMVCLTIGLSVIHYTPIRRNTTPIDLF
jgi:hypothetical protein